MRSDAASLEHRKKVLRNNMRCLLMKQMQLEVISTNISRCLHDFIVVFARNNSTSAPIILGYYPTSNEPNILPVLSTLCAEQYTVALPVATSASQLDFVYWTPDAIMQKHHRFAIYEPIDCKSVTNIVNSTTIVLTPVVACAIDGKRLGNGGGYYDRFFDRFPHAIRCGIAFSMQILNDIPFTKHDKLLDIIISEKGCVFTNNRLNQH